MAASKDTQPTTEASSARPGTAGRIDYDKWHKVTNELVEDIEAEDEQEELEQKKALGLDGKYAQSADHAEELAKSKQVKKAKKVLDDYQKRESRLKTHLTGLLGPVDDGNGDNQQQQKQQQEESKSTEPKTIRITRDMIDAGKRVVSIADTSGASQSDTIVLTSDLSLLESKMKANMNQIVKPKEYPDDAQNDVIEPEQEETAKERSVFGVIKGFLSNSTTVCKFISGSLEMSHCSNVVVRIEKDAMVATMQVDLCDNIAIEFRDAASGKSPAVGQKIYWGEDGEDRIFHAGVSKMNVRIYRDGYVDTERLCDHEADGAMSIGNASNKEYQFITSSSSIGNASAKEYQFITSVVDGELTTEAVVREGATTGENAKAMTKRELEESKKRKEQAAKVALGMAENMIKFKEKDGDGKSKVTKSDETTAVKVEEPKEEDDEIEEVYGSMSKEDIDVIVAECEKNKARGNEAFGAGEYAQAILLYSLALDKASELPDANDALPATKQLFPRDVVLGNRAASFLKLGQHEKAEEDAKQAKAINPKNVKAHFRQGLALHAMKKYQAAMLVLAEAHKMGPKNRQIKEALQFAEVRFNQEMRQRMQG
eukprot:CAMPEP_0117023376 /NCGR_PEP_ID=MMETSP0472-20121206/17456_1 /TAXON_ID=693140 ORGANISM="Tiarina fusus, Strain LIS" /NCGR_SAMPLE_ID=MMETSP0472 /ASSEMBLY_ACC=CAM_ASM_000603 /LENGTH=597 /DNA_ID=CAMNT_0004729483 /DNA_START=65 /DNA_END=1860 /DNA_ORIENTATION=+